MLLASTKPLAGFYKYNIVLGNYVQTLIDDTVS